MPIMEKFNITEMYLLRRRYSRQRIEYWEKRGYVPAHLLRTISKMTGRTLDELLCDEPSFVRSEKFPNSDEEFPA